MYPSFEWQRRSLAWPGWAWRAVNARARTCKDWGPKKVTIYFPIFYLVKSLENILFFNLILLDYVPQEITKEF